MTPDGRDPIVTAFTYDQVGNRTGMTRDGSQEQDRSYDAANQVVGWSYDTSGNLLSDGTVTYTYDGYNRLTAVNGANGSATFGYHGEELRVQSRGSSITKLLQDTTSGLSRIALRTEGSVTTLELYGAFGERLASQNGSSRLYHIADAQGTIRLSSDGFIGLGSIKVQEYDAWGVPTAGSKPGPLGYTGEWTEIQSGLVYLRARWYNPAEGTLLGRDPYAGTPSAPASMQPYQYGGNNPVTQSDPTGRECQSDFVTCMARFDPATQGRWYGFIASRPATEPIRATFFDEYPVTMVQEWAAAYDRYLGNIYAYNREESRTSGDMTFSMAQAYWENIIDRPYGATFPIPELGQLTELRDQLRNCGIDDLQITAMLGLHVGIYDDVQQQRPPMPAPQAPRSRPRPVSDGDGGGEPTGGQSGGRPVTPRGECSFTAETTIATPDGPVPISDVAIGDHVLAFDEGSQTTGSYTVTAVFTHDDPVLIHLRIDNEWITTTPEHPFFTAERGWVPAAALTTTLSVRTRDGDHGTVRGILLENRTKTMYNLTVATAHTFFVGNAQWLVHNGCWEFDPAVDLDWRGTGKGVTEALDEAFQRTGVPRDEFTVTRWGRDANGKSWPAEWRSQSGAEVNVDFPHSNEGPAIPHVGYQSPGKRRTGGAVRGHILLDDVPYNR